MKKVLITGISGFVGGFLAEHLLQQKKFLVHGTYASDKHTSRISSLPQAVSLHRLDLLNEKDVKKLLNQTKPDVIFHLAALSSAGDSFKHPAEHISTNAAMQIHIFEAMLQCNLIHSRVFVTSSANVYGEVRKEELPIDENTPLRPNNPYAVSKITQDFLALQYYLSYGLKTIRGRAFNHTGPRQYADFSVASFAKKIAEIEKGKRPPVLEVGNLQSRRDFTDVRDIVRAYVSLTEEGKEGDVYNIGSGKSIKLQDVLDILLSFTQVKIKVKQDRSLLRPKDITELLCDNSKLRSVINWKPEIPLEKTLKDTLDYWRNIV